jgi:integrase
MGTRNLGPVRKVRRRGKVYWVIDFFWFDKAGRKERYRKNARVQSYDAARAEGRALQDRAVREGTLLERPPTPTFRAFVEGSFRSLRMPHFRAATRVRYEALLRQGLLDHFGPLRLDAIGADAVHGFAAKLAERGVQGKGPLTLVSTILRAAHELGMLDDMPRIPRLWKEGRKLPEAPPLDDIDKLVRASSGWVRTAIALAAYAGLRSGEVRALEVRDVDLDRGHILVRRAFSESELTTPKSGHERRVPIAPALRVVLEAAVQSKLPRARVAMTQKGTTPSRQGVLTRLNALEAKLGLRGWTFHQLRHFFCTGLLRGGANVEAVRLLAGHSSLDITQRYLHVMSGDVERAMEGFQGR